MNHRTLFTTLALVTLLTALLMLPPTAHAQSSVPLPNMPTTTGIVLAIVPDGAGGVYIGGGFAQLTPASGPAVTRNGIARINADGSIHAWDPGAVGAVDALAVSGNTVYAGGLFTTIGGQPRNRIAALDATTGNATAWNPDANGAVYTLAVSGSTVYAGGLFTTIGGQPRNRIAALNAAGAATAWNPNANSTVLALAVSGSTVYAGGTFSGANSIGGAARNRIAALDATVDTNNATAWDPNATGPVYTLAVSGSTVYAGGQFTNIGGAARNRIAALDATMGNATAWNPNANAEVDALAVSGNAVYAGGQFLNIGGQPRIGFAAFCTCLSNLALSSGMLSPAFASNTTTYSASVANSVTSITVTPTSSNTDSTIRVNGAVVASGGASGAIALNIGANVIAVVITAPDGSTTTYTITVTRGSPPEVPEGDTLLLFGGGIGGLGVWLRWQWNRRRQQTKKN